jgi:hypothetical protein
MSGLALAPAPRAQRLQGSARARRRFWHDEKRFKGTGEKSLVQRALLALGGVRTGGNVKAAPVQVSGTERCWGGGEGAHVRAPGAAPSLPSPASAAQPASRAARSLPQQLL